MGLWQKIRAVALTDVAVMVKGVDETALEDIERLLIEADFGRVSFEIASELRAQMRLGRLRTEAELKHWLMDRISGLADVSSGRQDLDIGDGTGPGVILLVGVNGVGKTTQLAKLAKKLQDAGKSVMLAAADTFRAGATEQLEVWADRIGVEYVSGKHGGDPAAVVFDAIRAAEARSIDVVLVDTAGRLHTCGDLMEELAKIVRVARKVRAGAPHETLLVVDGTVGQNALRQASEFSDAIPLTGMIITKLDGTSKGGAVVAAAGELSVPVRFIGVGERLEDLLPFEPRIFAETILKD